MPILRPEDGVAEHLIETFTGYDKNGRPFLQSWKYRKTMTVAWGDGTLWHYVEFAQALDHAAMNEELKAIWERYMPQLSRHEMLSRGTVHGCMSRVPQAAGLEAMTVVREHFTRALHKLAQKNETADLCL
jgi:hypothetical protein